MGAARCRLLSWLEESAASLDGVQAMAWGYSKRNKESFVVRLRPMMILFNSFLWVLGVHKDTEELLLSY